MNKIFAFLLIVNLNFAQNKKFKVILDAGHGGKDYGATYHGNIEKNIALNTALKVGEILEKDPDIQVVYTRKTDNFVELDERANIANKSKGNLFVSMHCNANANQNASGNETYVMGITKSAANLEVAKKENSVVTLESNYKIKYAGFDPNKPESVIGISILQEENLQQSIDLAGKVQFAFTKFTSNKNRGVKQARFLVLRKIAMPRILIEMGFVSNKKEGEFLNSEDGQKKLAEAISTAILNYKKDNFTPNNQNNISTSATTNESNDSNQVAINTTQGLNFKIQISTSTRDLETKPSNFKGLKNISKEKSNSLYRYYFGSVSTLNEAKKLLNQAQEKGYTSAFIVVYKNSKKIPLNEAIK